MGFTLFWLGLIVLLPIAALVAKAATLSGPAFVRAVSDRHAIAAYKLSFGASLTAAAINTVMGLLLAWTLVRYRFVGRRLIDAMIDLPFALPTAVSGIALAGIYSPNGWIGQFFTPLGIKTAYSPIGVTIALTFVGLPFVVRTVQPALQELEAEVEEAAASLGASRLQIFLRVIVPTILPSLLTGFAMAFARALGEYGSVVFVGANLPLRTEIVPHLIFVKLEQFNYAAAAALGTVMLAASFAVLLLINLLQAWSGRHQRKDA